MTSEELAKSLVTRLYSMNLKISTAESCTGGLLCAAITSIRGSSNVIEYGIISYANRIKHEELCVSQEDLDKYGAVSETVALQMAIGVKEKSGADIGVSITGIAGPDGGSIDKPIGTVYVAISTNKKNYVQKLSLLFECSNNRELIRITTVNRVLTLLLQVLDEMCS